MTTTQIVFAFVLMAFSLGVLVGCALDRGRDNLRRDVDDVDRRRAFAAAMRGHASRQR